MASASASRARAGPPPTTSPPTSDPSPAQRRISNSAATLCSDYQALMIEIRKAVGVIKGVAVDLEKQQQSSDKVKQLEDAVVELLQQYGECAHYSTAIRLVAESYQPPEGAKLTDFENLLRDNFNKLNSESPIVPQSDPLFRQFKEAIWNVHHAGELMPGDENEDIVMTSTQSILLNTTCPLTGISVTKLKDPVRCMDCKHIYEKSPIMQYIESKKPRAQCPVAGCPRVLDALRIHCDPMLAVELAEMRAQGDEIRPTQVVEDCTEFDEDAK